MKDFVVVKVSQNGTVTTSRPRSGKTKIIYDRPGSRASPVVNQQPFSRVSQTHAQSDRPISRATGLSSTLRYYARSPTLISDKIYTNYERSRPSTRISSRCSRHEPINSTMASTARKVSGGGTSTFKAIEPAFLEVRKDVPGISIWRVELKNRILPLDEQEYGFFHEGAAYIVLKTTCKLLDHRNTIGEYIHRKLISRTNPIDQEEVTSLHYWTGITCSETDAQLVEEKATELDKIVNNANVLSKESQGNESPCFMRLFPEGIIYIESKPKTTVNRASAYIKRMYKVSGRKYIRAQCIQPSVNSLDSTSAFILDGHPRIYVWIGDRCTYCTRIKAIQMAKKIRNMQRDGIAHIIVIDQKDENMNNAFQKKLPNGHNNQSSTLNGTFVTAQESSEQNDVPCTPARKATPVTSQEHSGKVVLHRVSGERVMYDMPEAANTPLRHCYLVKRDSYLIDRGPNEPLFIWIGSQASESGISNAISRGKTFSKHRGYPSNLTICRVMEDYEPTEFKKNFYDWREKDTKHRQLTKKYSIGNIERALFSRGDNRTVAKMDECWSDDVFPDGDPVTQIWRVNVDQLEPLPYDQHGIFFNGQCYVILHRIRDDGNLLQFIYFWIGSKSTGCVQEKTVEQVLATNKSMSYENVVIRVFDEKEPQHFMSIIQNSIIVYDDEVQENPSGRHMYCIREFAKGSMRVQQVPTSATSLNSSASYIVTAPEECFVWYGKNSGGPEREYAKNMLGFLNPSRMYTFEIVTEGKESYGFWEILGKREEICTEFPNKKLDRRPPRLVYCEHDVNGSGTYSFDDADRFTKEDISDEDIILLDTFDQILLWVGNTVSHDNRKNVYDIARVYISKDPAGRNFSDVSLWMISHFHEPEAFSKYFKGWTFRKYGSKALYDQERKKMRQENAMIDLDQQMVDRAYLGCTKYEYKALLREELPEDVQDKHKEYHLNDQIFKEVTKHTRREFYCLPCWKQNQLLKSARLAYIPPIHNPLSLEKITTNGENSF